MPTYSSVQHIIHLPVSQLRNKNKAISTEKSIKEEVLKMAILASKAAKSSLAEQEVHLDAGYMKG